MNQTKGSDMYYEEKLMRWVEEIDDILSEGYWGCSKENGAGVQDQPHEDNRQDCEQEEEIVWDILI